ncbi:MAG: PTS glucose transporter subunit IIA, partial [Eubacterium sp.]|nr:PTS glucose transporter subunit IIA [Eubacterium sp.]
NSEFEPESEPEPEAGPGKRKVIISCSGGDVMSPTGGRLIPQEEIGDPILRKPGVIGKGVGIVPDDALIVAPFDGMIKSVSDYGHAIVVVNNNGMEVLIHIGVDTYGMNEAFSKFVKSGEPVHEGQALVRYNAKRIRGRLHEDTVIVLVTNPEKFTDLRCFNDGIAMSSEDREPERLVPDDIVEAKAANDAETEETASAPVSAKVEAERNASVSQIPEQESAQERLDRLRRQKEALEASIREEETRLEEQRKAEEEEHRKAEEEEARRKAEEETQREIEPQTEPEREPEPQPEPEREPGEKADVNVLMLGHEGHGKTTALAWITEVGADRGYQVQKVSASAIDAAARYHKGQWYKYSKVDLETDGRRYHFYDCPTNEDLKSLMIAGDIHMDAAILAVSGTEGPLEQTGEQIALAASSGIPYVFGYLSKCDNVDDNNLLELEEMEIRDLLSRYGYPGEDAPITRSYCYYQRSWNTYDPKFENNVVRVSQLTGEEDYYLVETKDCIFGLLTTLDEWIPTPKDIKEMPFLFSIDEAFRIEGRGVCVTGKVERGVGAQGDFVEILGMGIPPITTKILGAEMTRELVGEVKPGDNCGLLLRLSSSYMRRGMVVASSGSISDHTKFEAKIYFLEKEAGSAEPFIDLWDYGFHFRNCDVSGKIKFPDDTQFCMPGEFVTISAELHVPVPMEEGQSFRLQYKDSTVGIGKVTKLVKE